MKKRKKRESPQPVKGPGIEDLMLDPTLAGPGMADVTKVDDLDHWEDQLVEWLFVRHKIRGNVRSALRARYTERRGVNELTLDAWNDGFPSYPIFFVGAMIRGVDKISHGKLFCKFRQQRWLQLYEDAEEEYSDDHSKPLGLIIRWPGLQQNGEPSGGMVLHNRAPDTSVPGCRFLWSYNEPDIGMLTLQPLSLLIKEIDSAAGGFWKPD